MSLPPNNRTLTNAIFLFEQSPGPETTRQLYEALLPSTLVLVEKEEDGGAMDDVVTDIAFSGPKLQKRFHLLKGDGGRVALPAFTDPQSVLRRYPEGGKLLFRPAVEVARELSQATRTLVLNPTGRQPSGIHIPRAAIAALAEGRVPELPEQS